MTSFVSYQATLHYNSNNLMMSFRTKTPPIGRKRHNLKNNHIRQDMGYAPLGDVMEREDRGWIKIDASIFPDIAYTELIVKNTHLKNTFRTNKNVNYLQCIIKISRY